MRLALDILDAETAAQRRTQRRGTTVLVAASAACRAWVRRALEPLELDGLLEADDGLDAFSLALAEPIDLVLAEADLDRLDGVTLCQVLRAEPSLRVLPLVLLDRVEGQPAALAQADAVLEAGCSSEALVACVTALLPPRAR